MGLWILLWGQSGGLHQLRHRFDGGLVLVQLDGAGARAAEDGRDAFADLPPVVNLTKILLAAFCRLPSRNTEQAKCQLTNEYLFFPVLNRPLVLWKNILF